MQDFLLKSFDLSIAANNKRAYKNDGIGNLTVEEFETAFMYFDSKCAYSGRAFESKEQISIEHIIPITSGGHSMAFNCIPVIKKFNTLKSGYHLLDWWRSYKVTNTETLYTPYRHLKIVNYMLKALESINMEDKREYILTPDFVDEFLKAHENELNAPKAEKHDGKAYERLSQIEIMRALDLITVEDAYVLYNDLDGLKLNPAIFFEESLHVLEGAIPKEIIERINDRIKKVPDIYIDDKKVYRGVMDKEDVEIRNKLFKWAEDEHIENEFSVIGYLDFELLKSQDNLIEFLNRRKKEILEIIGAKEEDFGTIVNKIPNILTNLNLANRVKAIEENLQISTKVLNPNRNSEMYRYLVNKPDLILSGKVMDILLDYAKLVNVDKRLLKKGIAITTIIDNLEVGIEILNNADLNVPDNVRKRIIEKFINNSNGKLAREAYKMLKGRVRAHEKGLTPEEIERDASRWLICISEKYNSSELFNERRINNTRSLYKTMSFDDEGYMKGVNRNAYVIPRIIRYSNLSITRDAETNIINDLFAIKRIKRGENIEEVYNYLMDRVKKSNPTCDEEHVMQDAARWFVFLLENSYISLNVMFGPDREKYADITEKYYKEMKFDEHGNFINQVIPELEEDKNILHARREYMGIIDSFFNARGDFYLIGENMIPKQELQERLFKEIAKCKNKRDVRNACIRIRKEYNYRRRKKDGPEK